MENVDRPMRVLVLSNMYPPHGFGGYEMSCRDVVERWSAHGHSVEVLTSTFELDGESCGGAPGKPGEEPAGVAVRRTLRLYWNDHEFVSPPRFARAAFERSNIAVLDRVLGDFRPDVVSVWAMGAMSLGLLSRIGERGVPAVLVICDEWPLYGPHADAWLRPALRRPRLAGVMRALTGLAVSLPDLDSVGTSCFVSDHLLASVRRRSQWSFPGAMVVPSGISSDEFPFLFDVNRPWRWEIVYVGRIDPRKGIATAVRALAMCPRQATLTVHGDGDRRHLDELRDIASSCGVLDRVSFTSTPRANLARVYAAADAVVFPSEWEEPFGLVPIEAMSCGTPVAASVVGGASEFLIPGANCVAFEAGDAVGLAGALAKLARDRDLRSRLAAGGRDTAQRFGVERYAAVLEDVHRRACGEVGERLGVRS